MGRVPLVAPESKFAALAAHIFDLANNVSEAGHRRSGCHGGALPVFVFGKECAQLRRLPLKRTPGRVTVSRTMRTSRGGPVWGILGVLQ